MWPAGLMDLPGQAALTRIAPAVPCGRRGLRSGRSVALGWADAAERVPCGEAAAALRAVGVVGFRAPQPRRSAAARQETESPRVKPRPGNAARRRRQRLPEPNPSQAGSLAPWGRCPLRPTSGFLLQAAQQEGRSHRSRRALGPGGQKGGLPAASHSLGLHAPPPPGRGRSRGPEREVGSLAGGKPEVPKLHTLPHSAPQGEGTPPGVGGGSGEPAGSWEYHERCPGISSIRRGVPSLTFGGRGAEWEQARHPRCGAFSARRPGAFTCWLKTTRLALPLSERQLPCDFRPTALPMGPARGLEPVPRARGTPGPAGREGRRRALSSRSCTSAVRSCGPSSSGWRAMPPTTTPPWVTRPARHGGRPGAAGPCRAPRRGAGSQAAWASGFMASG